ncbi:hypothetical protein BJ165DRAFT_196730 [Panaeolus papilionaceus]|nr:hypothetical protein BJ165DRAFT_196730 [Panaeolus papilionaceus]
MAHCHHDETPHMFRFGLCAVVLKPEHYTHESKFSDPGSEFSMTAQGHNMFNRIDGNTPCLHSPSFPFLGLPVLRYTKPSFAAHLKLFLPYTLSDMALPPTHRPIHLRLLDNVLTFLEAVFFNATLKLVSLRLLLLSILVSLGIEFVFLAKYDDDYDRSHIVGIIKPIAFILVHHTVSAFIIRFYSSMARFYPNWCPGGCLMERRYQPLDKFDLVAKFI